MIILSLAIFYSLALRSSFAASKEKLLEQLGVQFGNSSPDFSTTGLRGWKLESIFDEKNEHLILETKGKAFLVQKKWLLDIDRGSVSLVNEDLLVDPPLPFEKNCDVERDLKSLKDLEERTLITQCYFLTKDRILTFRKEEKSLSCYDDKGNLLWNREDGIFDVLQTLLPTSASLKVESFERPFASNPLFPFKLKEEEEGNDDSTMVILTKSSSNLNQLIFGISASTGRIRWKKVLLDSTSDIKLTEIDSYSIKIDYKKLNGQEESLALQRRTGKRHQLLYEDFKASKALLNREEKSLSIKGKWKMNFHSPIIKWVSRKGAFLPGFVRPDASVLFKLHEPLSAIVAGNEIFVIDDFGIVVTSEVLPKEALFIELAFKDQSLIIAYKTPPGIQHLRVLELYKEAPNLSVWEILTRNWKLLESNRHDYSNIKIFKRDFELDFPISHIELTATIKGVTSRELIGFSHGSIVGISTKLLNARRWIDKSSYLLRNGLDDDDFYDEEDSGDKASVPYHPLITRAMTKTLSGIQDLDEPIGPLKSIPGALESESLIFYNGPKAMLLFSIFPSKIYDSVPVDFQRTQVALTVLFTLAGCIIMKKTQSNTKYKWKI